MFLQKNRGITWNIGVFAKVVFRNTPSWNCLSFRNSRIKRIYMREYLERNIGDNIVKQSFIISFRREWRRNRLICPQKLIAMLQSFWCTTLATTTVIKLPRSIIVRSERQQDINNTLGSFPPDLFVYSKFNFKIRPSEIENTKGNLVSIADQKPATFLSNAFNPLSCSDKKKKKED